MKKIYDKNNKIFAELNYAKNYYEDYSKHSHKTLCLSIISQGEIKIQFHNKSIMSLKPKQIVVFNPQEVHMTKSTKFKTKDYYSLHINIQNDVLIQNIIKDEELYFKILNILENFSKDEKNTILNITNISEQIVEKYSTKKNPKQKDEENTLAIEVKKYILNNINNPITLKDISFDMNYNESYISRVFKKKFGLTPHAFLVDKRVQKAKDKMLDNKEINLALLSSESGFFDQSHFTKAFKKVFAMTPNNYKKS